MRVCRRRRLGLRIIYVLYTLQCYRDGIANAHCRLLNTLDRSRRTQSIFYSLARHKRLDSHRNVRCNVNLVVHNVCESLSDWFLKIKALICQSFTGKSFANLMVHNNNKKDKHKDRNRKLIHLGVTITNDTLSRKVIIIITVQIICSIDLVFALKKIAGPRLRVGIGYIRQRPILKRKRFV